jgi:hypothetical protein
MLAELLEPQTAPATAHAGFRGREAEARPGARRSRAFDVPPDPGKWVAASHHRWQATTQLHARLWAQMRPGLPPVDPGAVCLPGQMLDTAMQAEMQAVFGEAALLAGLSHAREVTTGLRLLAVEQACIESLRESVLARLQAMVRDLAVGGRSNEADPQIAASASVIGRRLVTALHRIQDRFDAADHVVEDVVSALGDVGLTTRLIRSHRDEIQRAGREWAAVLDGHAAALVGVAAG